MGILRDFLRCVGETRLPRELAQKNVCRYDVIHGLAL
jgi:hypothetical protein